MKIQPKNFLANTHNNQTFNGFYNNKLLLKTLEFASDNGMLFSAGASVLLSTFVRPVSVLLTPNVEKKNKQYACAKSIATSIVNIGIMSALTLPVVSAVKNIEKTPEKFLNSKTIDYLKGNSSVLKNSEVFKFSSQIFKLGTGLLSIVPKTFLTCALIAPIAFMLFGKNKTDKDTHSQITFRGALKNNIYDKITDKLSLGIGKLLSSEPIKTFTQKYYKTNLPQHMFSIKDVITAACFSSAVSHDKTIEPHKKKPLIYNVYISTLFSITGAYIANMLLKKPTEKFIKKLSNANATSPKLEKYIEGVKIAKPALLLGILYYGIAPFVATKLADILDDSKKLPTSKLLSNKTVYSSLNKTNVFKEFIS